MEDTDGFWLPLTTSQKWVEAIPTKQATSKVVIKFMEDHIITIFGVPARINMDNRMSFHLDEFTSFYGIYGINIMYSSPYHPQANKQAKSNKKNILKIIKKILGKNKDLGTQKSSLHYGKIGSQLRRLQASLHLNWFMEHMQGCLCIISCLYTNL